MPQKLFWMKPLEKAYFCSKKKIILGWMECHSKQLHTATLREGILGAQIALHCSEFHLLIKAPDRLAGSWWEALQSVPCQSEEWTSFSSSEDSKEPWGFSFPPPKTTALLTHSTVLMLSGARWGFQTHACENTHCTCTQSPTAGAFTWTGHLCLPRRHSGGSVFTFRAHSHPRRLALISLPVKLSLPRTQD